ncbi:hypothetical protein CYG48_08950 [Neorhizobium sp. SOG26]|uniref:hypothetical protein n=1 Tax=Neorhizobium sp. SOG26 TaxID=2060726 RepID=UPI000E58BFEC|nr:hypothetical protein [Neorhizobium sp. SOG26]AXV15812.1 hypothetical protein CYG48_08950 [Neorhizobium sp. SOG26]
MAYLDHYLKARSERLKRQKVKKPRDIIKGQRREHVINKVMDTLKDWRSSPFENQGSAHAGLRSALCMQGHSWLRSDFEAGTIVGQCLQLMGAKYPTWEQGQPEYTVPRENCARCGGEMPAEALEGTRKNRFCSTECAKAAWVFLSADSTWRNNSVAWSAYHLVLKSRTTPRICVGCQETFGVLSENSSVQYCSQKCAAAARVRLPDIVCAACKKTFHPRKNYTKFCSVACSHAGNSLREYQRTCTYCDEGFTAANPHALFCSDRCRQKESYWRKKAASAPQVIYLMPAREITPTVFDGWFKRAA